MEKAIDMQAEGFPCRELQSIWGSADQRSTKS